MTKGSPSEFCSTLFGGVEDESGLRPQSTGPEAPCPPIKLRRPPPLPSLSPPIPPITPQTHVLFLHVPQMNPPFPRPGLTRQTMATRTPHLRRKTPGDRIHRLPEDLWTTELKDTLEAFEFSGNDRVDYADSMEDEGDWHGRERAESTRTSHRLAIDNTEAWFGSPEKVSS